MTTEKKRLTKLAEVRFVCKWALIAFLCGASVSLGARTAKHIWPEPAVQFAPIVHQWDADLLEDTP